MGKALTQGIGSKDFGSKDCRFESYHDRLKRMGFYFMSNQIVCHNIFFTLTKNNPSIMAC